MGRQLHRRQPQLAPLHEHTKVVRTIAVNEPAVDDIFSAYWQRAGR
jgi:hypothetical protein